MKEEIKKLIEKAVSTFSLSAPKVEVDYPKNEAFGDYSTNVAMILGKQLKKNPMEIAESLKLGFEGFLKPSFRKDVFEKIEVIKPGYVNLYLSKKYLQDKVGEINKIKNKFGDSKIGKGIKVNNEFISANPTGPLHLGNGRGGFLGDAISNVLEKCGFEITKEYYINDAGGQIKKLGHSVLKDELAEYKGEYIDELNMKLKDLEDFERIGTEALKIIIEGKVKPAVEDKMAIKFDSWISEKRDIIEKKYDEKAIEIFKKNNLIYEAEGALWLKTTQFGDDKDRVLIKKDGQKTYFASDCGYILYKIERDFDVFIEIWGADHHGYIDRFKAAAQALGFKGKVDFVIVQLVRLMKDGKEARMSKRAGNVVYIDELIDKVGLDVARFFFLMYSPDTHMNFDLKLAEERSQKNPVYYVQYAHARISSILKKSQEMGVKDKKNADLTLLASEKELNLIRELNKFPEMVEEICQNYGVHQLPQYAITLADKFHSFYNDLQVLDEKKPEMTAARLKLINAVRIVLAEVLRLIGVSAPDKM